MLKLATIVSAFPLCYFWLVAFVFLFLFVIQPSFLFLYIGADANMNDRIERNAFGWKKGGVVTDIEMYENISAKTAGI